jgi:hypothetical protein
MKTNRPGLGNLSTDAINQPCGGLTGPICRFDINDAVLTIRQSSRTTNFR